MTTHPVGDQPEHLPGDVRFTYDYVNWRAVGGGDLIEYNGARRVVLSVIEPDDPEYGGPSEGTDRQSSFRMVLAGSSVGERSFTFTPADMDERLRRFRPDQATAGDLRDRIATELTESLSRFSGIESLVEGVVYALGLVGFDHETVLVQMDEESARATLDRVLTLGGGPLSRATDQIGQALDRACPVPEVGAS